MEKKIYSRPIIFEIQIDSEINLVLMSTPPTPTSGQFIGMEESNESDGTGISQFMNPLKWFK